METDCTGRWREAILRRNRRAPSNLMATKMPPYVPSSQDFLWDSWKVLPRLKYGQKVEDLYDIEKLEKELRESPCAKQAADAAAAQHVHNVGTTYGKGFYAGLAMATLAVFISFGRK